MHQVVELLWPASLANGLQRVHKIIVYFLVVFARKLVSYGCSPLSQCRSLGGLGHGALPRDVSMSHIGYRCIYLLAQLVYPVQEQLECRTAVNARQSKGNGSSYSTSPAAFVWVGKYGMHLLRRDRLTNTASHRTAAPTSLMKGSFRNGEPPCFRRLT
jgi:hypothetical protein